MKGILPIVVSIAAFAAACGGAPDEDAQSGDEQEVKERNSLFGEDRVGDALRTHLDLVPGTFQQYEQLFKVGRACAREDSKEIFVVEESQSRATGEQKPSGLLPRAVVTGCNTDRANPDSVKNSFNLMAALVSSPDVPGASKGDPMVFSPLEVMALDRRTGTYNFYVFESNGPNRPGTITRVMRDAITGATKEIKLAPAAKVVKAASKTKRCFSCHVNGGPLMNEMQNPWSNWVSTRKTLPKGTFGGETFSVVSEAAPIDASHSRSSLANDLEQIMKAGIRVWINGDSPTTGFGLMTLEGSMPGGMPLLLKSVFCETELNYASSNDVVPLELFVDPASSIGSGILVPPAYASDPFPFQLPIRSEHDKRIEVYLQKIGVLTPRTVSAVRVIDDEHDVFSSARCALHADVVKGLPTDKTQIDAHVRTVIAQKLAAKSWPSMSAARVDYVGKLVDAKVTDATVTTARTAYFVDLKARFDKSAAQLDTASGRTKLKTRVTTTKQSAKTMFPEAANPLPILE